MTEQQAAAPHRVVIAGGGVAGLEALIALHRLAGDRVATTLLNPTPEFLVRALSVQDPFARPSPRRYPLGRIATDHGAELVQDGLASVDAGQERVRTIAGTHLPYDSLVVAIGARPEPAFERVITFRGLQDAEAMHGLIQDVEGGYAKSIAFVVPSGVTWPLPLYELALMAAERAYSVNRDLELRLITPEDEPLAVFGREAAASVARSLADAGVTVVPGASVREVVNGEVVAESGEVLARAQRIVALPRLEGPGVQGLAADAHGFVPVDEEGRVGGTDSVFAAGDGTTSPIKQGGLAAQQADAVARAITRRAGVDVEARPFRPVLRAQLLTGSRSKYLRRAAGGDEAEDASQASDEVLWWPPTKVAAPFLSPYLEQLDKGGASGSQGEPSGGVEVLGR